MPTALAVSCQMPLSVPFGPRPRFRPSASTRADRGEARGCGVRLNVSSRAVPPNPGPARPAPTISALAGGTADAGARR